MRLRPAALLASLTLCVATLSPPPASAADTLSIPPIQYRERTLPNGLQVLSVEDHASPNVAVQVWYHVGSKDDPQGRSGFAHLFEHLMFKSTKHMHAEQMDRLTEDVGGANNASTGDDITNYYEVVPSNHLQTLLWAEAERLSNLNVDEANFKSERAVVEEEERVANGKARVVHHIAPGDPNNYFAQKRSTLAAAMVFTAPGIPMLFQGEEFGASTPARLVEPPVSRLIISRTVDPGLVRPRPAVQP